MNLEFLEDYESIADMAKEWEELRSISNATVLNSHAVLCACLRHLPPGTDVRFLVMEQGGETEMIVPFAIFRHRVSGLAIRALSLAGSGRGMLGLYHSQPLVRDDAASLLPEMVEAITKLPWNTVRLTYLEPLPFVRRFLELLGSKSHIEPVAEVPCAVIDLSTTDKRDMIEGKFGKRLNRMIDELEENGRLVQRLVSSPEDAEESIGIYVEQHKRRWKKKGSSVFEDERLASFLKDLARTVTASGNGWINEVRIDGEVAGQQMMICEGRKAYAYRIGINESFAKFSPGHIVTACSIEALKAKGFEVLDLGPGEEWFKKRQGGTYQTLLNANARRGGLNLLANVSNMPGVNAIMDKLGFRSKMIKDVEG